MHRLKAIMAHFQTYVPETPEALKPWISEVLALAGLPDDSANRFKLAAQVQQFLQSGTRTSRANFVNALHVGQRNNAAFEVMRELKLAEKAEQAAKDAANEQASDQSTVS